MDTNKEPADQPGASGAQQELADVIDQLTAVLRGFAARLRVGAVSDEERRRYGNMLRSAATMTWPMGPADTERLRTALRGDDTEDER